LTFRIERGTGVSEFWRERLGWPAEDRVNNLAYDPNRPLFIFNATDARHGNRFLLGFPDLPRRLGTFHLERKQYLPLEFKGEIKAKGARQRYQKNLREFGGLYAQPYYDKETSVYKIQFEAGYSYRLDLERNPIHKGLDPFLIIEDSEG